jgi:hypothetical protein
MQKRTFISFASLAAIALLSTAVAAADPVKNAPNTEASFDTSNPAAEEAATRLVLPEVSTDNAQPDGTASSAAPQAQTDNSSNTAAIEGRPTGAAAEGIGTATP